MATAAVDTAEASFMIDEFANPDAMIEVDDESTSDYSESNLATSTQSLTDSVRDYVYENGRRYHRQGESNYALPNDETEQNRLDMAHHLTLLLLNGRLHYAPIKKAHRVLDCGTGTGIWALDFGETHPESKVIGVDIDPIQPSWVYPNVRFEVDNLDKDWTWPMNHFDFIHSRHISPGIQDWARYIKQMFTHCTPGGYVEVVEWKHGVDCDDGTYTGSTLEKYCNIYNQSISKAGIHNPSSQDIEKYMVDAGFEDIKIHQLRCPWGPWPKNRKLREIGATATACLETGLEAYGLQLLTRFGGLEPEEAKKLCQDTLTELLSRRVHAFQWAWYIVARKPGSTA